MSFCFSAVYDNDRNLTVRWPVASVSAERGKVLLVVERRLQTEAIQQRAIAAEIVKHSSLNHSTVTQLPSYRIAFL